jgi:hypothetical protein
MRSKLSNPYYHISYWVFIAIVLTLVIGRSWGNKLAAFYYICMLLPVIMGTSYFFNYYLVPVFLLKKKYFKFGLYFFYTIIVSLYLEIIVLTFSYIYLVNFRIWEMGPNSKDTLFLAILLYMVVFFSSFLLIVQQLIHKNSEVMSLTEEKEKMKKSFLEIISNRKTVRIPYVNILFIESFADYIKINTVKGEEVISKEKISNIAKKLPELFIRIHRSFIVNTDKVSRYNYNDVEIENTVLNIGRTYKKQVMQYFKHTTPDR